MSEFRVLDFEDPPFTFDMVEGVKGIPLFGTNAMITLVTLAPNVDVPPHSHPEEQLGIVLSGSNTMIVEGVEHEIGPMQGYAIPGSVPHGARAGAKGATMIEVFQPIRSDYAKAAKGEDVAAWSTE
jgi:quercetin dioxygenase-like cupin family protein